MIQTQKEIAAALEKNSAQFAQLIENQSVAHFEKPLLGGKWSAGQHLEHLVRSVAPLIWVYRLPAFFLKWRFGKTNRPSRDFDALFERYEEKYRAVPADFVNPFRGREVRESQRSALLKKFRASHAALVRLAQKQSGDKLDSCIVPHPLLGKITLRELLFFTIFHIEMHQKMVERDIAAAIATR